MKRDKNKDLMKLADAFYQNLEREDRCEYGGWGLDDKRPFGNSGVAQDILEIIGARMKDGEYTPEQEDYADGLYEELGDFLKEQWSLFNETCTRN